jgi:hypothetical protein
LFHRIIITIFTYIAFIFLVVGTAVGQQADLIFKNGNVLTVDENFSIVEALAVKGDRIIAVGSNTDILKTRNDNTQIIDLEGRMMLPGLIDSHMHPNQASVSEFDHPIPEMKSIQDVLDYIESRVKVVPKGEWIWIRTVFVSRLSEQRYPTRTELDAVAPHHPVIFATYFITPAASLNSLALHHLGIDRNFQGEEPGDIGRDPDSGEPTGIVKHHTRYIDDEGVTDPTNANERRQQFIKLMHNFNAVGLTTISDRNALPKSIKLYKELLKNNELTVKMSLMHYVDTNNHRDLEKIIQDINNVAEHPLRHGSPMLRLIGIKTFLDGGMLSGSAYMSKPWGKSEIHSITDPQYRGKLTISPDRLQTIIRATVERGLQFTSHSVGDGAVHELLDAYEAVNRDITIKSTRPCITHCNFMSRGAIKRMAEFGIIADIQPAWLYLDTRMLADQFGYDRLRYFQPLKSIFEMGVVAGGGSDHWHLMDSYSATNPYNPFLGMWITIARNARNYENRLYPEEALSREQAIRFYTVNNAFMLFLEDQVGTLVPGKFADMIIVDRDILNCNLNALKDTRVLQTYLNGKLVYSSDK